MSESLDTLPPDQLEHVAGGGFLSMAKGFLASSAQLPNPKHLLGDLWHASGRAGSSIGSSVAHLFGK